jgi:hypothetical protein
LQCYQQLYRKIMALELKISRVTIGDLTDQRIVSDYRPAIVNMCSQEVKSHWS